MVEVCRRDARRIGWWGRMWMRRIRVRVWVWVRVRVRES